MKKNLVILVMILVTFMLQSTLRVVIPAQYSLPNLQVILACAMGLMRGKKSGMLTGFVSGMLYDLFFGDLFGFTALCLMYIGYVSGFLYKVFFDNDIRIPMVTVAVGDLAYNLLFYISEFIIGRRMYFGSWLIRTMLPEAVVSVIATLFLYYIIRLINRRLVTYEVEEEQSPWLRR